MMESLLERGWRWRFSDLIRIAITNASVYKILILTNVTKLRVYTFKKISILHWIRRIVSYI